MIEKRNLRRSIFTFSLVFFSLIAGIFIATLGFSRATHSAGFEQNNIQAETIDSTNNNDVQLTDELKKAMAQVEALQSVYRYVADRVQNSVVQVIVTEKAKPDSGQGSNPFRFFFGPDSIPPDSPQPYSDQGLGSGIIIRKLGNTIYIITNNHVIDGGKKIEVITFQKEKFNAEVVGVDALKDLALLKCTTTSNKFNVAVMGNSANTKVGDITIAVGNPYGFEDSTTMGIVSAIGRNGGPRGNISDFIQTDAAINKGNSGGALANIRGEIIGMNTWIASPSGGSIGLGFAIPINNIKKSVDDLISRGKIQYGWLGISMSGIDTETSKDLQAPENSGVLVTSVFSNSPAKKGGILPGDVIIKVNNNTIHSTDEMARIVGDLPVKKSTQISLIRAGKEQELNVTIDERKTEETISNSSLFPGLVVISLKSSRLDQAKLQKNLQGVFVDSINEKSPASVLGIKQGDIITAVNGKAIKDIMDFYFNINNTKNNKVSFILNRDGESIETNAYIKK